MRYSILLCCSGLLFAQGTEPKKTAEEYEVHAVAGNYSIGAEFDVHSFSRGEQMFLVKDYLVVQVAIFPPKGETYNVQITDFTLRLNGKNDALLTAEPTVVAAAMNHPEWREPDPNLMVHGRIDGIAATIGGPPVNTNPFPGSPPPPQPPHPRVEVPEDNPTGIPKTPVKADELLLETALVEGLHHAATSGFLYFPYRGKVGSIKSIELVYRDAVMKLR